MEIFFLYPWLLLAFVAIFGLIIGSFLNVVIYRLPKMMESSWQREFSETFPEYKISLPDKSLTLSLPASHCPSCQHKLKPWHNIPLLSWLILKGRCSYCDAPISIRYPAIELISTLACLAAGYQFGASFYMFAVLFVTFFLICCAGIDFDTHLLPDSLTLPLMWLGILMSLIDISPVTLNDSIIGTIAGYVSLWSVYWIFKLITKKEGMGYGDFKLFAALGAWLGWQALPLVILISSFIGIIFGLIYLKNQHEQQGNMFPFGPCLAIAGWITLVWKSEIFGWYMSFLLG
ncbi:A24 family peptidase [Vibrio sp.]|uniref:Prepilin leader peptidase/N-methyltransferase n=1 Tax=Vibrio viridaestus TaxID=2487322 RepID=A0A3N9THY8_9VIBR|nr:A24 family peptidase [Vibrio viridaestus]MDC0610683.1 A24 family peptidase [Vibrio sp.]RQW63809.1 prepilin peptidase [Vibrio viridaestus]